ncbi:hypothetical protein C8J57DRAFT_1252535 [Mycena rebaudengoi]|nr:hypothetical protein C8J57DRAFT_1252535 [Mycena rebaudengoi]
MRSWGFEPAADESNFDLKPELLALLPLPFRHDLHHLALYPADEALRDVVPLLTQLHLPLLESLEQGEIHGQSHATFAAFLARSPKITSFTTPYDSDLSPLGSPITYLDALPKLRHLDIQVYADHVDAVLRRLAQVPLFLPYIKSIKPSQGQSQSQRWLWPASQQAVPFWQRMRRNFGFGLAKSQARPKANPGQTFGLALALVPKPKSRGFLASGQSQTITSIKFVVVDGCVVDYSVLVSALSRKWHNTTADAVQLESFSLIWKGRTQFVGSSWLNPIRVGTELPFLKKQGMRMHIGTERESFYPGLSFPRKKNRQSDIFVTGNGSGFHGRAYRTALRFTTLTVMDVEPAPLAVASGLHPPVWQCLNNIDTLSEVLICSSRKINGSQEPISSQHSAAAPKKKTTPLGKSFHWDKFDYYARRVRCIVSANATEISKHSAQFLQIAQLHGTPVLPRLRTISGITGMGGTVEELRLDLADEVGRSICAGIANLNTLRRLGPTWDKDISDHILSYGFSKLETFIIDGGATVFFHSIRTSRITHPLFVFEYWFSVTHHAPSVRISLMVRENGSENTSEHPKRAQLDSEATALEK